MYSIKLAVKVQYTCTWAWCAEFQEAQILHSLLFRECRKRNVTRKLLFIQMFRTASDYHFLAF